jgi:hypothetical protein
MNESTTLYIPLDDGREAVLNIAIAEDGLGALDPQTRREPTARELSDVAALLRSAGYRFNSTLI